MARKGLNLTLVVLVLMPFAVSADDRSPAASLRRVQSAPYSSKIPASPQQRLRKTTYGLGNDPQAKQFNSLDHFLDVALGEADDGPAEEQEGRLVEQAVLEVTQDAPASMKNESSVEPDEPIIGGEMPYFAVGRMRPRQTVAARFGWWFVDVAGDPTKVGEYQGLGSSAFWDVDMLSSNGHETLDLTATGLDNESSHLNMSVFGPKLSLDMDFQRYLHRLDHDPLTNLGDPASTEEIVGEDLNVGEDYAVRVQDMKYSLKGSFTKNVKGRVNFRVLRKFGERQTNTVQHCANFGGGGNRACHVLGQRQRIDWLTVKVEPIVETKLGPVRAEYSRPMRFFSQNDQLVIANYGDFVPFFFGEEPYAVVPDSFSQTDRIKLGVDLGANTNFYATSYLRNTTNQLRDTNRKTYGIDLRLTNRSCDGVKLTAFATLNDQTNQNTPFLLPEEEEALGVLTSVIPPWGIRRPIDYFRKTIGADTSWQPFRHGGMLHGLSVTAGTEYGRIDRKYAAYVVQIPTDPPGPVYNEERTDYFSGHLGTSYRWSPQLDTFVRYKLRSTRNPLFGVTRLTGFTNTSLPDQQDLVEIGGTWMPADNFMATATVGLNNRSNDSDVASFQEDDYPMTYTLWYAPTCNWSLSAGYGYYSNWINQDISFPSDDPAIQTGDIRNWNYGGQGQVVNFGSNYAYSETLTFLTGVEFVHSRDAIDPFEPWPDLPFYSDVVVDRTRVTAGIDWLLFTEVSTYFRYVFEDYEDRSVDYNSGTTHMVLAGLSAVY